MKVLELLSRITEKGFPQKLQKEWLCAKTFGEKIGKDGHVFVAHYKRFEIGDIIPLLYKEGLGLGYYKVLGWSRYGSGCGDYAGWDDQREYNLKFVRKAHTSAHKDITSNAWKLTIGDRTHIVPIGKIANLNWRYLEPTNSHYLEPLLQVLVAHLTP